MARHLKKLWTDLGRDSQAPCDLELRLERGSGLRTQGGNVPVPCLIHPRLLLTTMAFNYSVRDTLHTKHRVNPIHCKESPHSEKVMVSQVAEQQLGTRCFSANHIHALTMMTTRWHHMPKKQQ